MERMKRRHEIRDEEWEKIVEILTNRRVHLGGDRDHRLFMNGVIWIAKTGAGWRDLPERFGQLVLLMDSFSSLQGYGRCEILCVPHLPPLRSD